MSRWQLFVAILLLQLALLVPSSAPAPKRAQGNPPKPGASKPKRAKVILTDVPWRSVAKFKVAFKKTTVDGNDPNAIIAYESAMGHGGRYDALQAVVSRKELIESDHSPHYSLTNYLDNVADLPDSLKKDFKLKKQLMDDLNNSDFQVNKVRIKELTKLIETMEKKFASSKISVKDFPKNLEEEYHDKITEMKKIYRDRTIYVGPPYNTFENVIKIKLQDLANIRDKARLASASPVTPTPTPQDLAELDNWENEKVQLESTNIELERPFEDFTETMKGKMGTLSLPFKIHRLLPSTGGHGLNDEIEGLKDDTADNAKIVMETYEKKWKTAMESGFDKKYITGTGTPKSWTTEEFLSHWKDNFDTNYESWTNKPSPLATDAEKAEHSFRHDLHGHYAKYWMTRVIYAAKKKSFKELNKLYITEYEVYLGTQFDYYKKGIQAQLGTTVEVGLLESSHMAELITEHNLDQNTKHYNDKWQLTQNLIDGQTVSQLSRAGFKPRDPIPKDTLPVTCFKLRGGSRDNCIFEIRTKSEGHSEPSLDSLSDSIFPEIPILGENQEIISINSDKLTEYLESFRGRELTLDETRAKEAVVELVGRNQGKLVGPAEHIQESKAYIRQELLNAHNNQVRLARAFGRDKVSASLPVEALSNYDRVRVGSHNFVRQASKFTGVVDEAGGAYGKIMLANGFVTALRDHDVTGLAILGGRVGLDIGLQALEKTGSLMARKLGTEILVSIGSKMSKFIGKIAGPIGGLADIGISIYSLTNSIKALNDPAASKWQQNDAIADIVSDSINIAVTAATVLVSVVFPPLAPVMAVVSLIVNIIGGFAVAAVRAADHVAELNEQVPLLDWEKREEYNRNFIGQNTSQYLLDIVKTKQYNNILANQTMLWLKDNTEFKGIFVPSKTVNNGKCTLVENICSVSSGSWFQGNCRSGGSWPCGTQGSGQACSNGMQCAYSSYSKDIEGTVDTHTFECSCELPKPDDFSQYDVLNNVLDLSKRQSVYEDRSAPDFVLLSNFYYYCRPNSLSYNKLFSNSTPIVSWLSEGALGMIHSVPGAYLWLYDLKTGNDKITLDPEDKSESIFRVGDGVKSFTGGGGDDTFFLQGPCSGLTGTLDGGGWASTGNSLVLGDECWGGKGIKVDLKNDAVSFGNNSLGITRMEQIIGRKSVSEEIYLNCGTRFVAGKGGLSGDRDRVAFPSGCSAGSRVNVTVLLEGHSSLDMTQLDEDSLVVVFVDGKEPFNFDATLPTGSNGTEIFFKFDKYGSLQDADITVRPSSHNKDMVLHTEAGVQAQFTFICGSDSCNDSRTETVLMFSNPGKLSFQLQINLELPKLSTLYRVNSSASSNPVERHVDGIESLENVFYLESGVDWVITGSPGRDDVFFLRDMGFVGSLFGGGGWNTLVLAPHPRTEELISILESEVLDKDNATRIKFYNIHSIIGRDAAPENALLGCGVKQVALGGGSGSLSDSISLLDAECDYDVNIIASGNLMIRNEMKKGTLAVQIGPASPGYGCDLILESGGMGEAANLVIFANYSTSDIVSVSGSSTSGLQVRFNNVTADIRGQFRSQYALIFSPNPSSGVSSLITRDDDGEFIALHNLTKLGQSSGGGIIDGIPTLENRFSVSSGHWDVQGCSSSGRNNIFSLNSPSISGTLMGGQGVGISNKILFSEKWESPDKIRIDAEGRIDSLQISNMDTIVGRRGLVEELFVPLASSTFAFISLQGGASSSPDVVHILDNGVPWPDRNLTILAVGTTSVVAEGAFFSSHGVATASIYLSPDVGGKLGFNGVLAIKRDVLQWKLFVNTSILTLKSISVTPGARLEIGIDLPDFNYIRLTTFYPPGSNSTQFSESLSLIFIKDSGSVQAELLIDPVTGQNQFLHFVTDSSPSPVRGSPVTGNVFKILSKTPNSIHGSPFNDVFILESDSMSGTELFGYGGLNSLVLSDTLNASVIQVYGSFEGGVGAVVHNTSDQVSITRMHSIHEVVGRAGKTERVETDCFMRSIQLGGGSGEEVPDQIWIKTPFCFASTTIIAGAHTEVYNEARLGNFSYVVQSPESFEMMEYSLGGNLSHSFLFEVDSLDSVDLWGVGGVLYISFNESVKSFKVWEKDAMVPQFQFLTKQGLAVELVLDNISEDVSISAIVSVPSDFSRGDVMGIDGISNQFLVYSDGEIGNITGSDGDDNIFLSESSLSIQGISGGPGLNRLSLLPTYWNGSELEIDLRENSSTSGISLVLPQSTLEVSLLLKGIPICEGLSNTQIFIGRGSPATDRVTVACDTVVVAEASEILVPDSDCNYDLRIAIGAGTRVRFTLSDEEPISGINYTFSSPQFVPPFNPFLSNASMSSFSESVAHSAFNPFIPQSSVNLLSQSQSLIEDDDDDDSFLNYATYNDSIFYYDFSTPTNFDIEVDDWGRLSGTRHIFNLPFNLSDIFSIRVDTESNRLIYSLSSSPGTSYSHGLGPLTRAESWVSNPSFTTGDGWSISISAFAQILFSFGNLEETLENPGSFVPILVEIGSRLGGNVMIETGSDFLYSGIPSEPGVLSNRDNTTSHLIGWNGTIYQIFGGVGDVYIYPQNIESSTLAPQIVDVSDIIGQIDTVRGNRTVPIVSAVGLDLVIAFEDPEVFPGRLVLVNGTILASQGGVKVLLRRVLMNIQEGGGGWELVPGLVSIPQGHVLHLDGLDAEQGTKIGNQASSNGGDKFTCARDGDALVVTNIGHLHEQDSIETKPTTFVISNIYGNPDAGEVLTGVDIRLGAGGSLCREEVDRVRARSRNFIVSRVLPRYSDILMETENGILKEFPGIKPLFNATMLNYFNN